MISTVAIGLAIAMPVVLCTSKTKKQRDGAKKGILHTSRSQRSTTSTVPVTVRNLSKKGLQVIRTERFRLPDTTPTLNNGLLGDGAVPYDLSEANFALGPFESVATGFIVHEASEKDVGRITFSAEGECFQLHLHNQDEPTSVEISSLAPDDSTRQASAFLGVFHPAKSHLAIIRDINLSSWMRDIPDRTALSSLSIPGTHNSPTCYRALPSVRCQSVSVTEQLEHGIRFLDVRCQPTGNKDLILVHGAFPISFTGNKRFQGVLDECYAFLDRNPSEVIIMSLKREGVGKATDHEFARILKERFVTAERWWTGSTSSRVPTIGQTRGKMVLMRRFKTEADEGKVLGGIDAAWWPFNTPNNTIANGRVCVQDYCEVIDPDIIESKITYVLEHMCRASESISLRNGPEETVAFINFMSAANFSRISTWPEEIARKVNPCVNEFLAVCHGLDGSETLGVKVGDGGQGCTGIMLSDFVGDKGDWMFCRLVVAMNDRLLFSVQ